MRFLASISWLKIWLVAIGWPVALLIVTGITLWRSVREAEVGGNLAARGFGIAPRGWFLLIVPPLILLVLRAVAGRGATGSS